LSQKPLYEADTMRIVIHYLIAIVVLTIYGGQV
jgi:hypothetical protein